MNLTQLMRDVEYTGTLPAGQTTHVTQDSRKVREGSVFVAVKGQKSDGHEYAQGALDAGAALIVTQRALGLPREVVVADTRAAYALMSQNYFGHPAKKLVLVAVTGTNGKTTVSSILKQVLQACGHRCGLIGTIRSEIGEMEVPARFTTPEAWDVNALLARMVAAGCTHAVMEASSQALAQGRLYGLQFALGVFTNLSRDHLDYHGTMDAYFEAKALLFAQSDAALINLDDTWGEKLFARLQGAGANARGYSAKREGADCLAREVELLAGGVRFGLQVAGRVLHVDFPMPGEYSVYNALAVLGAAGMLGCRPMQAIHEVAHSKGVPGRCQVLYGGSFTVVCDFAHTADGLEKLLSSLRPFVQGRMVVLYGCAGNRDPAKRRPMSETAVRYGDEIFLTSDNPRTESEEAIFADALAPLKSSGKAYHVVASRETAVYGALDALTPGDMLVLCGKGHEDYQVLNGTTVYLSEEQLVHGWLCQKGYLQ